MTPSPQVANLITIHLSQKDQLLIYTFPQKWQTLFNYKLGNLIVMPTKAISGLWG